MSKIAIIAFPVLKKDFPNPADAAALAGALAVDFI
jgi:hypothetical protein